MNCTLTAARLFVRTSLFALAAISALIDSSPAVAVDYDTNVSGGDWGAAGTWTPAGVPISGNSVTIDLPVTVSSNQSFGNGSTSSLWSGGGGDYPIQINPGVTLTHVLGSTFTTNGALNRFFSSSGTFANYGTVLNNNPRMLLGYPAVGSKIDNFGTFEFTTNGSLLELYSTGTRFNNQAGGTVRINLGAPSDRANIMGSPDIDGQYVHAGGNPIDFVQGVLVFSPPGGVGGTLTDSLWANLFGAINANSYLEIGGGISNIQLDSNVTNLSRVGLGSNNGAGLRAVGSGTTINVTGTNGLKFANGVAYMQVPAGRTMTNVAGSYLIAPSGQNVFFGDSGTFLNQGTLRLENNRFLFGYPATGSKFHNSGLVQFVENGSRVEIYNTGANMTNLVGGTLDITLPTNASVASITPEVGFGPGVPVTFQNLGTVQVNRGIFRVVADDGNVTTSSWTSSSLDTGTWKILAAGVNSTLDLQLSGTSVGTGAQWDGSITTLSSGANLVFNQSAGGVADFPQLGLLSAINGSLYVHGNMALPVANAASVSGTLGGNGQFATGGTITFSGGTLDPISLTGGPGTLSINGNLALDTTTQLTFSLDTPGIVGSGVNDLVAINGNLTLDGVLEVTDLPNFGSGIYRLFNYTGTLTNNGLDLVLPTEFNGFLDDSIIGQINLFVVPVPEPSTGLLLLVGLAGMARVRRRKRSA